jgi:hypothetical protein
MHGVEGVAVAISHAADELQLAVPVHAIETQIGVARDIGHAGGGLRVHTPDASTQYGAAG